jgi:hypothetical protein
MVDNVTVPTTGTGTATPVIATDDVGGVHYQRFKISNGEADSAVHLGVYAEDEGHTSGDTGLMALAVRQATPANLSGTDGDYEPLQMNAGALWVSPLGFPVTVQTDVTRPADVIAYSASDCISDSTSAPTSGGFTLTGAARKSGGSGMIIDALICTSNDAATKLSGEVMIFNQAATNVNDNTAYGVSDTEIKTLVAAIPFSFFDAGNNGVSHITGINAMFTCVGSANLRFHLRARNAYTPASAEVITVTLKILQLD